MLDFLQKQSKTFYINLTMLSLANSIGLLGLLSIINSTIQNEPLAFLNEYKAILFVAFAGWYMMGKKTFQTYLSRMINEITLKKEIEIFQRVRNCDFKSYERMGSEKVYTALADSQTINTIPQIFIKLIESSVLIISGIGFLFWVMPLGAIGIIGVMSLLLSLLRYLHGKLIHDLNRLRDLQDNYYRYLKDYLFGHRELKVSPKRLKSIFDNFLVPNRKQSRALELSTTLKSVNYDLIGSSTWYGLFFMIMFIFPFYGGYNYSTTATFLIVLMYLMRPVEDLISSFPFITRSRIALQRLNEFNKNTELTEQIDHEMEVRGVFKNILLHNITYTHKDEHGQPKFVFGPVHMNIKKGEILFVTGGNGSGKSTFLNLLIGLYSPEEGSVYFDDEIVTNAALQKANMSVIFSDHYMLTENYDGFDLQPTNERLNRYIELMKLQDVLKGINSQSILDYQLSRGQQKRLALIYSLLEDKSILVFDEWAAEQSPEFKQYFYCDILPQLKMMGKTIVVATHDDRFFRYADRVLEFEFGKIVVTKPATDLVSQ